eukprot:scaffold68742_cov17-Tisochrysis_lutea.AAC.1
MPSKPSKGSGSGIQQAGASMCLLIGVSGDPSMRSLNHRVLDWSCWLHVRTSVLACISEQLLDFLPVALWHCLAAAVLAHHYACKHGP